MSFSSIAIAHNKLQTSFISMEDYILVVQPDEIRDDDNYVAGANGSGDDADDDDASYDYCEDVFSHGAPEDAHDDDVDDDNNSVDLSICSRLGTQKDNIILTVPSTLMKDLDEAHAAAELARVPDLSAENESPSPSSMEDATSPEPKNDGKGSRLAPTPKELNEKVATKAPSDPSGSTSTPPQAAIEESLPSSSAPTANLSRASNKKRRKKLKLSKKALAAAKAAEALIGRATNSGKGATTKKVVASHDTSARGTSRKVANIAVACARETMASYRNEVICSTMG